MRDAQLTWLVILGTTGVTAGIYGSHPPMIPPMAEPQGSCVALAEAIKSEVRVPVIGGIRVVDPLHAESLLAQGRVDMVLMGRALLADPELPNKARAGRLAEIRKCVGCNQCLEITEGAEAGIHCLVNPGLGREGRLPVRAAQRRKRVAVVGGGPAGMKAAEVLAQRGHHVALFERNDLGGRLRLMARLPGNGEMAEYLESLESSIRVLGVDVRQSEASERTLEGLGIAALVVATGGVPAAPRWARDGGIEHLAMDEAFSGAGRGRRVLVWGADLYALSTGLYLAEAGSEVVVAEVPRFFRLDPMEVSASALYLRVMLAERGVEVVPAASLERIAERSFQLGKGRRFEEVSTVVTCALERDRSLERRARALGIEAYTIGDARWPRKSAAGSCEAFELAARL